MLQGVLRGDAAATERLYRTYVRYLSALCSRYITDDEDIKDVLQEAFLKIFSSLDTFEYRGEGSLKGWMARIVLNETLQFVRNQTRNNMAEFDEQVADVADEDMETEDIPTEMLYRFIRELPAGYRTVFNLYVVEGKSHKEIAEQLGIKVNTSASQLFKAKAMLAQRIKLYRSNGAV